jgi:enoyl-CoA hydratase
MAAVYVERTPLNLAFAKLAVRRGMQMDIDAAIKLETALVSGIDCTEDKQVGISAFLGKHKAEFKGE